MKKLLFILPLLLWVACEDESEGEAPIYGLWEWRYYYNDNSDSWDTTETATWWSLLSEENYFERYLNNFDTDSSCYSDWAIVNSTSWEISAEDSATLIFFFPTDEVVISMKAVEDSLYWYFHHYVDFDVQYLYYKAVRIDSYDFSPLCE